MVSNEGRRKTCCTPLDWSGDQEGKLGTLRSQGGELGVRWGGMVRGGCSPGVRDRVRSRGSEQAMGWNLKIQ